MSRQLIRQQYGVSFNGNSDYAYIAAGGFPSNDWNGQVSISFWVYFPVGYTYASPFIDNIWGSGNNVGGFQFYIYGQNQLEGITAGTATTIQDATAISVDLQRWNHIVVTKNVSTTTQKIYLNSVLMQTNSGTTAGCNPPTVEFALGCRGNISNNTFDFPATISWLSDIVIWNREISATEVSEAYSGAYPISGLIHHWDFHEGSGAIISDVVGGVNFTLNGGTWLSKSKPRTLIV